MAGSPYANFVAENLIGNGSRSIQARLAALEANALYSTVPGYFPDSEVRSLSAFAFDENGNPGFFDINVLAQGVPYAIEVEGTPVSGNIVYTVTGTVSYSDGSGINSAIPGTFTRIPSYNTKVAFSTTGAILADINDATIIPFGQGYFTGSSFLFELKTEDGVSRFTGSSVGQIESVTNWNGITSESGGNTISISPPSGVTVAVPGQLIESSTVSDSVWFKGNTGLYRMPVLDEFGFLYVNGVLARTVTAQQINNIPRDGELIILPDYSYCTCIGDGVRSVAELYWDGTHSITIDAAWVAANSSHYQIRSNARKVEVSVTINLASTPAIRVLSFRKIDASVHTERTWFSVFFGVSQGSEVYLNHSAGEWKYSPTESNTYMLVDDASSYLLSNGTRVLCYDSMTPSSGP